MMNCNRCGGWMTYEEFYGSHGYYWGWRCIHCGEILDEIILENRRASGKGRVLKGYGQETREAEKDDFL